MNANIFLLLLFTSVLCFSPGDKVCFQSGLNLRSAPCGDIAHVSQQGESGTYQAEKYLFAAYETGLVYACSGGAGKNLQVPMVHQRWDTGNSFNGNWACGPTSAVMAMAYFGKIAAHPIETSTPYPHSNDYGYYVSAIYNTPLNVSINRMQLDASGNKAYGEYGWCTEEGAAWAWRIQDYAAKHGLHTQFYDSASLAVIQQEIDKGNPIVLSTMLSNVGHLILIRGYIAGGSLLYANDPWGDATKPNWGKELNGGNVRYEYSFTKPKWMVVIRK